MEITQISDYVWTVTITYEGTDNARNPGEEANG
jgi:hypothetical protein